MSTYVRLNLSIYALAHGNFNECMGRKRYSGYSLFEALGDTDITHHWIDDETEDFVYVHPDVANKILLLASPHYKAIFKAMEINNKFHPHKDHQNGDHQ